MLWGGQFRSCLLDHSRTYKWSSYCVNAEVRKIIHLTPYEQYLAISRYEVDRRRKEYRAFFKVHVDQKIDDQIREASNGNFLLGNSCFQ